MRPVQYLSDDYLRRCRALTPDQILRFLDEFRQLHRTALLAEKQIQIERLKKRLEVPLGAKDGTPE